MSSKAQKRKSKKKYFQSSKKPKANSLEPGMKGFLITCNNEQRCVKEAYNLLNEFADGIYGPEFQELPNENSEDVDISDQLAKEISAIKAKKRFQQVFIKAKGIIFINTIVPDPISLVNKIFETVISSGKQKTRFILKIKPVVATCKAHEEDIHKTLDSLLKQYVLNENNKQLKYKVESKVTFNDRITSSHFIWYVRDSVKNCAPDWEACIMNPQIIISFYVICSICCISILENYEKYKKYNLSMIASSTVENPECQTSTNISLKLDIPNEDRTDKEIICENNELNLDLSNKDEIVKGITSENNKSKLDNLNEDRNVKEIISENNVLNVDISNEVGIVKEITSENTECISVNQ